MGRRTLESLKREQAAYKGLHEKLAKLCNPQNLEKSADLKSAQLMINQLMSRAQSIENIVKESEKEQPNSDAINRYYNELETTDLYFGFMGEEQRKKIEQIFEQTKDSSLLKNPAWHAAYGAFMATRSLDVTKEADEYHRINAEVEKEKAAKLVPLKKEANKIIGEFLEKYPYFDVKEFMESFNEKKETYKRLEKEQEAMYKDYLAARDKIDDYHKQIDDKNFRLTAIEDYKTSRDKLDNFIKILEQNRDPINKIVRNKYFAKTDFEDKQRKINDTVGMTHRSKDAYYEQERNIFNKIGENKSPQFQERVKISKIITDIDRLQKYVKHTLYTNLDLSNISHLKRFTPLAMKERTQLGDYWNEMVSGNDHFSDVSFETVEDMSMEDFDKWLEDQKEALKKEGDAIHSTLSPEEQKVFDDAHQKYSNVKAQLNDAIEALKKPYQELYGLQENLNVAQKAYDEKMDEIRAPFGNNKLMLQETELISLNTDIPRLKVTLKGMDNNIKNYEKEKVEIHNDLKNLETELDEYQQGDGAVYEKYNANYREQVKIYNELFETEEMGEELKAIGKLVGKYVKERNRVKNLPRGNEADVLRRIQNAAGSLYDKRDARRGSHKNTVEFDNMIDAMKTVKEWPNENGNEPSKFRTLKAALDNLRQQTTVYLKAKDEQRRLFPTVRRTHRIEYAKSILLMTSEMGNELTSELNISAKDYADKKVQNTIKENEKQNFDKDFNLDEMNFELVPDEPQFEL